MKKILNWPSLHRITRSFASFAALFTMVMTPVAEGAQVQNFTKAQIESALEQMGLNKQITYGEFYKKNKDLFPPRIQKEVETLIMNNRNMLMPQAEVVMSKASDGRDIPNLRFTQGNDVVNTQWFGETDRFVKIQNTNLTEVDLINFNDIFTRLIAGDEKIRKEFTAPSKTGASFNGFPAVSNLTWKAMSQKERAGYIVQMRLLWNDARRVLIELDKRNSPKGRKTSSNEVIQKIDQLFALIADPSEAAANSKEVKKVPAASIQGGNPNIKSNGGSSAFVSGDNCIVAGYVSKYTATKCSVENIYDSYTGDKNSLIQKTREECQATGQVACNPYVYGTPGGKAACISMNDSFQKATHFDGPCEALSSLGGNVPFLKNDLKNGDRYKDANRSMSDKELDEHYFVEQELNAGKSAENFLNGLLAYGGKAGVMFSEPLTADILKNILSIKQNFDGEIAKAKQSCEAAAANKNNEKNFWGACDQLHRRFLNVARFLEKHPGCKDGGKINPDDLLCACPAPKPGVIPGTSCGVTPPSCPAEPVKPVIPLPISKPPTPPPQECIPTPVPPTGETPKPKPPVKTKCEDENYALIPDLTADCKCPNGKPPELTVGNKNEDTAKTYECKAAPLDPKKSEGECGILCGAGKFLKEWGLKIAGTALVAYGVYKILKPKKPTIKSPGDICDNGTNAPCPQSCPVPQVYNSATAKCGCAVCPVGQSADSSTCFCSSTPPTPTTTVCWDGSTVAAGVSCPARTYTCWDGTVVPNVLNCPEKPATSNTSPTKNTK